MARGLRGAFLQVAFGSRGETPRLLASDLGHPWFLGLLGFSPTHSMREPFADGSPHGQTLIL